MCPVICRISSAIKASLQQRAHIFLPCELVLLRQGHEDPPRGGRVEVGLLHVVDHDPRGPRRELARGAQGNQELDELERRCGAEQVWVLEGVQLLGHQPRPDFGLEAITFIGVYPPRSDGPLARLLITHTGRNLLVNAHVVDGLHLLCPGRAREALVELLAVDVVPVLERILVVRDVVDLIKAVDDVLAHDAEDARRVHPRLLDDALGHCSAKCLGINLGCLCPPLHESDVTGASRALATERLLERDAVRVERRRLPSWPFSLGVFGRQAKRALIRLCNEH